MPEAIHRDPRDLSGMASAIERMAEEGYTVVLDEFQYFHRKAISEFTSHLQAVADRLSAKASEVPGGLIVLGSVYTEMKALLDDKTAPLYNRVTDTLDVDHLDPRTVAEILATHGNSTPEHLLFMWNLFEGVPKFYRDCFEQDVIAGERSDVIRRMFFGSSSPLRHEAENWFLSEFRGEYDVALKYVAAHPGCTYKDIRSEASRFNVAPNRFSVYLTTLETRYRLIEKRAPIFAGARSRKSRYYIRDNFLRSWLNAVAMYASAQEFRPVDKLVNSVDKALPQGEGYALEQLAGLLYESRSKAGVGDFELTRKINGYWNSKDTEIDLVAVNDENERIRFVTCRRSPSRLAAAVTDLPDHVERFLKQKPRYAGWDTDLAAVSTTLNRHQRENIAVLGAIPQDLTDLLH